LPFGWPAHPFAGGTQIKYTVSPLVQPVLEYKVSVLAFADTETVSAGNVGDPFDDEEAVHAGDPVKTVVKFFLARLVKVIWRNAGPIIFVRNVTPPP
jgi:hypothetical protein